MLENQKDIFENIFAGKISVGDKYASYKDLCVALGEKTCSGNQKVAQIKEWKKYFDFKRNKYAYTITTIYPYARIWQDNRSNGSEIQNLMRSGLLSVLNCYQGNNVQLSYKQLFGLFGMVNRLYGRINLPNLKKLTNMEDKSDRYISLLTTDFYTSISSEFKRTLDRTFKSLQRQKVLMYMPGYNIVEESDLIIGDLTGREGNEELAEGRGKVQVRCADKDEISYILGVESRALCELGLQDSTDLFLSHKQKEFYGRVGEIIKEEKGWLGVYQIVDIVFNPETVKRNYDILPLKYRMNNISLTRAKKLIRTKVGRVNNKVHEEEEKENHFPGDTKKGDMLEGKLFFYGEEYVNDIDKIIEALIKINEE